jgi:HEAT repeat protein
MLKNTNIFFIATLFTLSLYGCSKITIKNDTATENQVTEFIKDLGSKNEPGRRIQAAISLGKMGPKAERAIPALIRTLQSGNDDLIWPSFGALGEIGEAAVPSLISLIENENEWISSPDKFQGFSIKGTELVSETFATKIHVWDYARSTLAKIGKPAVPHLIKLLNNNKDPSVRKTVVLTLADIGPDAKEALPALKQRLSDPDKKVVGAVAYSISKIAPIHTTND